MTASKPSAGLPLAGLRVADFCWIGAGSYTTKILGDLGADVIKIESSTRLDSLRLAGPYKGGKPGVNRSGYFADRNTSKRGITIDMKHPAALDVVRKLIAQSDIVANNFAAGVMEKFGLGPDACLQIRPDIIYLAMSMQGSLGPQRDFRGTGSSIAALTGIQELSGLPGRVPAGTGTNYPDHLPNPCHAAFAVLAALRHRRRTGQGQFIDFAQTEPMLALMGPTFLDLTVNHRLQQRRGNDHPWAAPHGVYPCAGKDRWIAITVMDDAQWSALVDVMGRPAWALEARWQTMPERYRARAELDRCLAAWTADHEAQALMASLQARGIPAGAVQDAHDVVRVDPQLAHRQHWVRMPHAEMGESIYNNLPFRLSRTPVRPTRPAPLLGEHTREVLHDLLGLSDAEIDGLQAQGVLK
ncbi:Succinyl-CoA:(R)-benzylsuccinate CoA-transferase subunit BbsF (plasmid) [Variovorax sp. SRS16]|uniref:CaiB/BaiF CoA transferase family protein n=1 Tax=Variovorax sp. SRS16 TaxID=282217 RepID=UPI001315D9E4|nr:CoA transferase [Variovorax sp. SRS16]VTU45667.1 Succinyl-CoA:(R)-benzylsuccinate CoA-transferase subunit BbsF [Variovorax sp. SRS16]